MLQLYKNIKSKRQELGLSQEDLAKLTGYTDRTSISKIEAGKVNLNQTKIADFARALKTTQSDLMGWDEDEPKTNEENIDYGFTTLAAHISGAMGITKEQAERVIEIAKMFKDNK